MGKIAKNGICSRMTALSMALCSMSFSVSATAENWNLSNAYGPDSIHAQGNVVFAETLSEKTNGEITVTVHAGGSLGYASADHFDAVSDGAVELADTPGNFLGGVDSFMLLSSLPFLATTVEDAQRLMALAKPEYEKTFAAAGQKLLYMSPWPASGIWAKTPVDTAADIAGVKIRTFDPNGTKTFKALGAAPIQLPWADVPPQLATGGISAVLTSAEGGVNQNFVEFTPYFTEINYALPLNFVHMNADIFDALSDEHKAAVLEAAEAASARNWAEVVDRTQKNYAKLTEAGGTVVTGMSDTLVAELAAAADVVLAEWLEKSGERGKAMVDAFQAE